MNVYKKIIPKKAVNTERVFAAFFNFQIEFNGLKRIKNLQILAQFHAIFIKKIVEKQLYTEGSLFCFFLKSKSLLSMA